MSKTLVIYYSRKGNNYTSSGIRNLVKGNTKIVAEYIRDAVGADLFEVDTVVPYSTDYTMCTKEAQIELRDDVRPELKAYLDDISTYDNIVVAGPCWWGTYPCAVFTQLEKLDFSGIQVFAVMTHEGSGQGQSVAALQQYCRGATHGTPLAIRGSEAAISRDKVIAWARQNLV